MIKKASAFLSIKNGHLAELTETFRLRCFTYWVVGSDIASESSSNSSGGSRMASSYKLKLLSVCTMLQHKPCASYKQQIKPTHASIFGDSDVSC